MTDTTTAASRIAVKFAHTSTVTLDGKKTIEVTRAVANIAAFANSRPGQHISVLDFQGELTRAGSSATRHYVKQEIMEYWNILKEFGVGNWFKAFDNGEAYMYTPKPLPDFTKPKPEERYAKASSFRASRRLGFNFPMVDVPRLRRDFQGYK